MKDFGKQVIIAIIAGVLAPIITNWFTDSTLWVAIVAALVCLLWPMYLLRLNSKLPNLGKFENTSTENKRYSVVIVDDEFAVKKTRANDSVKTYFDGYDLQLLKSVNDCRLLEAYDVVVLDVFNANEMRGNTHGIFEDIKKYYPEKYVIAMSQNNSECKDLFDSKKATATLPKPTNSDGERDVEKWMEETEKELKKAFDVLDFPKKYWSILEDKLPSDRDKAYCKERYVEFLRRHTNYRQGRKRRLILND